MFEEWLEGGVLDMVAEGDDEVIETLIREAYKLGLQRGYDCTNDSSLAQVVFVELQELNKDD